MDGLLFGTAGVPEGTPGTSSQAGVIRIRELGLDCMELAFVRSVRMGEKAALSLRQTATEQSVRLSVHAPYYINLNSLEPDKVEASRERILKAARVGWMCGAKSIVFHAAFYHEDQPEKVYERVRRHLKELVEILRAEENGATLRPETTGKSSQFGSLEEVLSLSAELEGVAPCVDFAHLHARSGKLNSYEEFCAILESVREKLGPEALKDMHIHISGIEYSPAGEREHLMLEESDLRYLELLHALKGYAVEGLVVCESPDMAADALLLQRAYREIKGGWSCKL